MSDNQENVSTPNGRNVLNVSQIDRMSLNSPQPLPRSPLGLLNEKRGDGGTPKGRMIERKILTARVLAPEEMEAKPESNTPKGFFERKILRVSSASKCGSSSKRVLGDNGSSLSPSTGLGGGRSLSLGARQNASQRNKENEHGEKPKPKLTRTDTPAFVSLKGDFSVSELLNKPILHSGFSPIREEAEGEGFSTPKNLNGLNVAFKRPSPPYEDNLYKAKRPRSSVLTSSSVDNSVEIKRLTDPETGETLEITIKTVMETVYSESALTIKRAVERINSDPNLLGDGSKGHILPVMPNGKHNDLKEITPSCLASLIEGEYSEHVLNFEIIDCRYPYEFNGGHIQGAINLHTKRQVYDRFFASKDPCSNVNEGKRSIVVFHCEFSSQRGPDMCRYVRDCDRKMNEYPFLHYPELYVLFGGYKAFFESFKPYCNPQVYLPMVDENFAEQYRMYKSMSKTDVVSSSTTKKKSFSKSQGKLGRSSSMKKLCLDNL